MHPLWPRPPHTVEFLSPRLHFLSLHGTRRSFVLDVILLIVAGAFFAASILYAHACDQL
jgi:hypothetical protein